MENHKPTLQRNQRKLISHIWLLSGLVPLNKLCATNKPEILDEDKKGEVVMRKTTYKNYKWGVVVTQYGAIEWIKLFNSKKEAQKYIDALTFTYKEEDILLWNRKECEGIVKQILKEEDPSILVIYHHPEQSNAVWMTHVLGEVV